MSAAESSAATSSFSNAATEKRPLQVGRQKPPATEPRLQSLDAYRGLIMVTLAFEGFGLAATSKRHLESAGDSSVWQGLNYQFSHVQWTGCAYWDLIQPSFMFMVGTAMAYSYAKRAQLGHSWWRMFGHAFWRSILLIFLGIFLISNWGPATN